MNSDQTFDPKTIVTDGKRLGLVILDIGLDGSFEQIISYNDEGYLDYVMSADDWHAVEVGDVASLALPFGTEVVVDGLSGVALRDRIEFSDGSTMTFEQYAKASS